VLFAGIILGQSKVKNNQKLSYFRVSDNYVRFYLKYILSNKQKIEKNVFIDKSITTVPAWDSIMGLQFENLILHNRQLIKKILHIPQEEIIHDNPYFQRKKANQKGCQIDYMIQTRFNCLYLFEIKFSKNPVQIKAIEEMKEKISNLALPKNFSYRPVLIHINGVDDVVVESEFFANIIDFGKLLDS
jgi:uncharacterized protein